MKLRLIVGYSMPIAICGMLIGLACLLGGYVLIGGLSLLLCGVWTYVSYVCFFSHLAERD